LLPNISDFYGRFITYDASGMIRGNQLINLSDFLKFQNSFRSIPTSPEYGFLPRSILATPTLKTGKKWGMVDKDGKVLISPEFDAIGTLEYWFKNIYSAVSDNKITLIDFDGKIILKSPYDWIGDFNVSNELQKTFSPVRSNNKYGIIDSEFKEIITADYDTIINLT
jgi:hypothetical protein